MCFLSFSIREKNRRRNWPRRFSLTAGFSPVYARLKNRHSCFNSFRLSRLKKPLKRLVHSAAKSTWLKPGVNQIAAMTGLL